MKIIKLDNCKNIRDICYTPIKEKKIIRSSSLHLLSKEDIKKLEAIYKVRVIIDLRTSTEIAEEKDVLIPNTKYYNIQLVNEEKLGITHGKSAKEKLLNISNAIPNMNEMYIDLVKRDKKRFWTTIIDILLHECDGAILWHCKQGKDRCGIVSAIIESILGLDQNTIMKDYLLSNNYYEEKSKIIYDSMLELTNDESKAKKASNLFLAKEEYLNSAFNYIKEEYGNLDIFYIEMCNLNEEKIKKLKDIYLIKKV